MLNTGSPPQVRGKHKVQVFATLRARITPAGAGKTRPLPEKVSIKTDHPRRCGENKRKADRLYSRLGSPPQVRGKRCQTLTVTATRRITPAGAGKTIKLRANEPSAQDHPRRCGENSFQAWLAANGLGSPPQVRGKHRLATAGLQSTRITPAGAGKTTIEHRGWECDKDHPRRCGENGMIAPELVFVVGSPPQVRGKLIFLKSSVTSA